MRLGSHKRLVQCSCKSVGKLMISERVYICIRWIIRYWCICKAWTNSTLSRSSAIYHFEFCDVINIQQINIEHIHHLCFALSVQQAGSGCIHQWCQRHPLPHLSLMLKSLVSPSRTTQACCFSCRQETEHSHTIHRSFVSVVPLLNSLPTYSMATCFFCCY